MMNRVLYIIALLGLTSAANAQDVKCGFDRNLDRMISQDPSRMQVLYDLNARVLEMEREEDEERGGGGPRIIPTVFHVLHQGGSENISYEQIEDQIRILNEDYRRLNEDTVNTREVFEPVAADANVEFRLAKLDPMGNCTDGVVRIWSPLTYNASDNNGAKGVSYWNSTKYFNVWVVSTIDNDGEQGTVLGYAQFPGFGSAQTDGVVVRADYIGNVGTGAGNGSKGRTLTHEAGHWLGLFHTFQGGCAGGFFDDGCDDTPPQAEATPSNCPQNANTCTNDNPDLPNQVENYMDYSNGACQNMFTFEQKGRMDAVFSSSRTAIFSQSNLNATGVLLAETPCAPVAQFYASQRIVCAGDPITFTDDSYNGEVTTYNWTIDGATPNTSTNAEPTVVYAQPGTYTVTQVVSNAQGSDTKTLTDYITVIPSEAAVQNYFSFEGFEETEEDYIIISDELGNTWEETNAAYTDSKGIYLKNYSGNPLGSVDEFQLPSVDLTMISSPSLYFQLSYKTRTNGASDNFRIYVSRDCGDSWQLRYNKSGNTLATVSGSTGSAFTPTSTADWELRSISLSQYANDEHVLVKFRGVSDEGNNIYLDDIQISGPLGVHDQQQDFEFTVGPNPMTESTTVILDVANSGHYQVALMDVTGKLVQTLHVGSLAFGQHRYDVERTDLPSAGVYFIEVQSAAGKTVKKLIVQ